MDQLSITNNNDFRYSNEENQIPPLSNLDQSLSTLPDQIKKSPVIKPFTINFALTNARSLTPKVTSMVENFCELDLGFMLVTESWLKQGTNLPKELTDLEHAENLKLLHKSRKTRRGKNAGGGVCVVYDKSVSYTHLTLPTTPYV